MNVSPQRKTAVILAALILFGGAILLLMPPASPGPEVSQVSVAETAAGTSASPEPASPPPVADYGMMLFQMIVSVALVCLLAYAILRWGLGRVAGANSGSEKMRVLSRLGVGPNRSIMVVQVGPKCLVLGNTETEISLICELSENDSRDFFDSEVLEVKA